jgi:hypothetical protein
MNAPTVTAATAAVVAERPARPLSISAEGLYTATTDLIRLERARDDVRASKTMSTRARHVIVNQLDVQIGKLKDHITACMNADGMLP